MAAPIPNPSPPGHPAGPRPPPVPVPSRPGVWGPVGAVLALLLLAMAAALAGLVALLRSEPGTQWLLRHAPGIEGEGVSGALLGPRFAADRLRIAFAGGQGHVLLEGLALEEVAWRAWPQPGAWAGLSAARATARRVEVQTGPASAQPAAMPASLRLPLRLSVAEARVGELRVDALEPMTSLEARGVELGADGGARHAVTLLAGEVGPVRVRGPAAIGADAPFPTDLQARIAPRRPAADGTDDWSATARAQGPLDRLRVEAQLQGRARDRRPAPALQLQAELLPFRAWPVGALQLRTEALDLRAFAATLPQTLLSGRADIRTRAAGAPVEADVALVNAEPGRWNEGRVPLRRATATLAVDLRRRDRVDIGRFDLQLGDGRGAAGRWQGSGRWDREALLLDSRVDELQPQRLDGRAAAMTVSGPIELTLHGLAGPGASTGTPAASAPQPVSSPAPGAPLRLAWRGTLEGRLDALPRSVTLSSEGEAQADRVRIRHLRASAGPALASLVAEATRGRGEQWRLATQGSLTDVDPLPWWPGEPGSAWRAGPHRLNATWDLDVLLPRQPQGLAPMELVQRLSGRGQLRIADSMLAGAPLQATLQLGQAPGSAETSVSAELLVGANRLALDGRASPAGDGRGDRWSAQLTAPELGALAPLARLVPSLADWQPRQGRAEARASAEGRWPAMRSEGEATVQALRAGALGLDRARASWRLATAEPGAERPTGAEPVNLLLDAAGLTLGAQRVALLRADLRGTLRQHTVTASLAVPVTPPEPAGRLLGLDLLAGTQALLQGDGAWAAEPGAGGVWRGRVARLAVGPWDGRSPPADAARPEAGWVDARELRAEARIDGQGRLVAVQAEPGRVLLAGGVRLRWDEVSVDLRGQRADLRLEADIEPFAVAPLLARAQPTVGWTGDLRLAARLSVKAGPRMDAELVVERSDGDLAVQEEGSAPQPLGLTDLRLALTAHDGTWTFAQALAGRSVGEAAGAVTVRTTPERRWPARDAPMEGVLQARVSNLAVWSAWVPAGWRLTGNLATTASVGGTFAAPQFTGELRARDVGLRNLLQGVNLTEGDIALALQGAQARIERFTVRGGAGLLTVEGGAELGEAPRARLRARAERFQVLGRIDRQLAVSGNAEVVLSAERLQVDGRLVVDKGLFDVSRSDAPALDGDVTVRRGRVAEEPEGPPPVPRPRRDLQVTLGVDLGQDLRLRGRGLDTFLRGDLRITTPSGRLAVNGSVRAEQGTYQAYGQKLEIERGIVAFSGPLDTPRLDILAMRPNTDVRVGVAITGTAVAPRVRLYSEPEMADTDKLSWLVLGRAPEGLGRTDTALLQTAALALLAGEGAGPTDQIIKTLGLDELSLRQTENGDVRDTVISLGKQLSRRWYVGYERGVNATTGTWQLIYRIAQRFTLRAQSGEDSALDLIWTWRRG